VHQITVTLFLITLMSISGCATWPPQGSGGMAEHQQEMFNDIMPDEPLGVEHGLRFELDLSRRHLDVLVIEGAELCFPATVTQARQRNIRITRELHGGLKFDAANDLIIQRNMLERLERQLDYVHLHDTCNSPKRREQDITSDTAGKEQDIPSDMTKKIYHLLNVDNQFATDSSEINPKYIGHLAEATILLRDQPGYHLLITGHADDVGIDAYNYELSMKRARQVGRYLLILGFPAEKIEVAAVGSDLPLSDSQEPHHRLVNRRVSVELVEVTQADNQ
jgi:outer membrane protein OmpA-like peptidoglycan-associated protein